MPRTKQRKAKPQGYDQIQKNFNRLVKLNIQKMEIVMKDARSSLDTTFESIINRFPIEIQNMTLGELVAVEKTPKKENIPPKTPKLLTAKKAAAKQMNSKNAMTLSKRTTATSDDGYQSESTASQASRILASQTQSTRPTRSSSQGRREPSSTRNGKTKRSTANTRSSSQGAVKRERSVSSSRTSKLTAASNIGSAQKKPRKEVMKTPAGSQPPSSFVITPKIKLNSAIKVLRKPKDGEMVFSTSGSPLLVSTTVNDRTANVNVPLQNGNVVSLLPINDASLSENFHLDEETKNQLKILHSHLARVLDK